MFWTFFFNLDVVIFPIWGNWREGDHPQSHTVEAELNMILLTRYLQALYSGVTFEDPVTILRRTRFGGVFRYFWTCSFI